MSTTRFVPLRTAALCACLLPFALLTGCGGGSSSTPATPVNTGPVTSMPRTANGLQYTLSSDKSVYKVGETVNLTFTLANVSSQPIGETVGRPGVIVTVTQGGHAIWQTPQPPLYGGGTYGHGYNLLPGTSQTYTATWPQTTGTLAAGQYTLTATLTDEASDHLPTDPIQITLHN